MKKRILLLTAAVVAVAVGVVGMSAFEAHVINVTAKIENALSVLTNHIDFGTVFPQEYFEEEVIVTLSSSFLAEDRVDDVNYFIRQKPKPLLEENTAWCHENIPPTRHEYSDEYLAKCYPLLCYYLSKTPDGEPDNDESLGAFHPMNIDVLGRLVKSEDEVDIWTIDFDVPCFDGQCAQDWTNQGWELPPALESATFGCDLWIEVTGINEGEGGDCIPTTEVCDGIDNDCDGEIDEDLVGELCPLQAGVCNGSRQVCAGASGWLVCSSVNYGPNYETTEISCDGLDNDCDGEADEGGVCGECSVDGDCDDGVDCTNDTCESNQCVHTPSNSMCSTIFNPGGDSCRQDYCDPISGCQYLLVADGVVCSSLNCAIGGCDGWACQSGVCTATQAGADCSEDSECDDSNPCTSDSCPSGHCVYVPVDGGSCNSGQGVCQGGACIPVFPDFPNPF
jgi:hypothetical protein